MRCDTDTLRQRRSSESLYAQPPHAAPAFQSRSMRPVVTPHLLSLQLCLGEEHMPPHTRVVLHERQLLRERLRVLLLDVEEAGACCAEELHQDGGTLAFGHGCRPGLSRSTQSPQPSLQQRISHSRPRFDSFRLLFVAHADDRTCNTQHARRRTRDASRADLLLDGEPRPGPSAAIYQLEKIRFSTVASTACNSLPLHLPAKMVRQGHCFAAGRRRR